MTSKYTQAPQFVDTSKYNLALIEDFDKEIQRINQDYAVAGKAIRDFKSKVNILKLNDKTYFDEKYNSAIDQFSANVDLTKRGQINQLESVLTGIVTDPTIKNAIQSSQQYAKVEAMRAELKTNPKYVGMHKAADEFAEQQIKNAYIKSEKLGESFNLSGPIITMNTDKLITDTVKGVQYEEKTTNFGPVNTISKYKSGDMITSKVYQTISSNPEAIAAERNEFNYKYQTPEAKKQLGIELLSFKDKQAKVISSNLETIDAQLLIDKNPVNRTNLLLQQDALKKQLSRVSSLNPEDESSIFQSYLLKKSLEVGENNKEYKQVKVELDQFTKYFTDQANKDRDFKLREDNFKADENYRQQTLDLKRQEIGVDPSGRPLAGGAAGNVSVIDGVTTFSEDADVIDNLKAKEIELQKLNSSYGQRLIQIIQDSPDTSRNKLYNDYKRRGLIVDHSKSGLFSPREFQNLLTLKAEFIKNSGVELDGDLKEMDRLFEAIADNNEEYELMQALKEKAKKDAGIKEGTIIKRLGMDTEVQKKYISALKSYTQSNDVSKEVIIADYNESEDRKSNYNAVFRSKIRLLAEQRGVNSSGGPRYAVNNTMGGDTGAFGNKTITKEQSDRIDWGNSLVTLIPGKQNSVIKLRLSPKDKDKSLNLEGFKDGYAYLTVDNQLANEILAPKGLSVESFQANKNVFTNMNAMGLTRQEKNKILGQTTIGIRTLPIGNTRASYQIEARDGNEYFIKMNVAGTEITKRTTIPKELLKGIEMQTSALYRAMKNSPNYSTKAFNVEAVNLIKTIINN